MAVERDLELLDDYLSNRLSGSEKEAFEKQIDADPELKNEFQAQQQLIEGIKNARAVELKAMLKNVPVPPMVGPGELTLFTKVAASLVVAGLIGTGIYFYINREDKVEQEQMEPIAQADPETKEKTDSKSTATTEEPSKNTIAEAPVTETTTKAPTREEKRALRKAAKATKKASKDSSIVDDGVVAEKRKLEVFDPTRESESAVKGKEKGNDTQSTELNENSSSIQVETDITNKKYTFHYQWRNGKLVLYGSFEKNLYEILEFFGSDNKRTAFLYYKENYYLLNEDNEKVKELTPITDAALLKKLKEHREN